MLLLLIAVVLFVSALVQGIVGFAMAVVAIPLLVWGGLPLSEAIAISASSTCVQAVTGMIKLRHAIPWPIVRFSLLVRLLTLPLGILILVQIAHVDPSLIRAYLGGCIILLVLLQIVMKVTPRERLAPGWDYLAFASSGLFAGMVGMGGPTLVLWLSAHRWPGDRIRAFLFANFAVLAPVNLILIWLSFGPDILPAAGTGLLFAPIVIVGSLIGVRLGNKIPRERFRRILFGLLIALGLISIASACWG